MRMIVHARRLLGSFSYVLLFILLSLQSDGGSIVREVWTGIGGNDVSILTSDPRYPDQPSSTNLVTDFFEAPTEFDESYGQRMHGYIVPPVTGNYTFWIASDDGGQLWLSTDSNPANQQLIATVNGWTSSREWGREANQQSAPIALVANRAYYIAALQKEGGGGDNLAVRWARPDGADEAPIPATYLLPWGTAFTPPAITQHPANTTVVEGQLATFMVEANPLSPSNARWQKNGVNIPNADSFTLTYGPVLLSENQARFRAVLTNTLGSATSSEAILTVTPDVTAPQLFEILNLGPTTLRVTFSEAVDQATATNPQNYSLTGGLNVTGAVLGSDNLTVLLTTSSMTFGNSYTLTVNNVRDRAATPNAIASNSTINFTAYEYAPAEVGGASGSTVSVPGGFDVTGAGSDIGGRSDQFQFGYQERTGDFDLKVRINALTISDPFVQAGLLARESMDPGARFAGIFASSAELGCFFESRSSAGGQSQLAAPNGGFPVNYPDTYLRLRRSGSSFTGYASFDGKAWQQLGSVTMSLPSKLFFGMAVSSHDTNAPATAQFRDLGSVANPTSFTYVPTREPIGPSNRRTGLIFSEIMYNPPVRTETNNFEFIEIYNAESIFADLSGWRITGGVDYEFPEGFILEAGEFVVVAADPGALQTLYGISNVLGPFTGSLNNSGEAIQLLNTAGAVRLDVEYAPDSPWPVAADGAGHSLILARPSFGEDDVRAWSASTRIGGSPGQVDPVSFAPNVVINEFLAHTDEPVVDFIELYNASNSSVDISGYFLSDDPSTNKFQIPAGTTLPARGFISFDQDELGFALSSGGETIYLVNAEETAVIDVVRFNGQENGVSSGRTPDGSPEIRRLASRSSGDANALRQIEPVVINEIMYHPISEDPKDAYIELHNRSGAAVDLGGWAFTDGIDFEFPSGASIPAGGYAVVANDIERLLSNYPQLSAANTFGNYDGNLSKSGEHIALSKPDTVVNTNEFGGFETNLIYIAVSEVSYFQGGRWPELADGGGSSLELIDARSDTLSASNWRASDETQKAPWTSVETTARLRHGNSSSPANRLYIGALGAGEALIDDVEIFRSGGQNLLSNAGFESGQTGWNFYGHHRNSTVDTGGAFAGQRALHLRAPGDGDTAQNTIRANLSTTLSSADTVTIRAKVRWLSGWPEVLFRVRGNWIELPARMDLPPNLGTPGQANSRRVNNAPPAISDVNHSPALPRANQAVVVTARINDPDGVATPQLRFRVDPASTLTTVQMRDDGAGGDALANDGIYSGTISGRGSGTLVAFHIQCADDASPASTALFPLDVPTRECLIRWNDEIPFGTFSHYHMWNTSATEQDRNSSSGLDNTYRDATLVYGDFRIIYNAGFRDKGSPYHGGTGDFAVTVPADDLLLGSEDRVFGSTGNGGNEGTGMKGDVSAWIGQQIGIPYLHSHYTRLFRNGGQFREILYDLEQPNRDYAESWFGGGGDHDDLFKIAVWFEFDDSNSGFQATGASFERFPSTPPLNLARYRWNWQIRAGGNTANDYTSLFNLILAANSTADRTTRLPIMADMEEWMRVYVYNRILGNWDSWVYNYGQNMYLYAPLARPAALIPWDVDFVLGEGDGTGSALWGGHDSVINQLIDLPMYRRMIWRAYLDAINGPLLPENYNPQIDARRTVLLKNGVGGLSDPRGIRTYIDGRRNFIRNQLESADTDTFAITSNNNGANFTTANSVVTISGTAPFAVATIEINGVPYPVNWTGHTTWSINVPLGAPSNLLQFIGRDLRGNAVAGASDSITVTYTGTIPQPDDWIVINEIMYNSVDPDADYIELHNRHPSFSFDLSGMELQGIDYDLPAGTFIPGNGYVVIAQDRVAFAAAYGSTIPTLGPYAGNLQNGGETLRLVKPGATAAEDVVLDDVRYDNNLPWPPLADGEGPSLQLIDPAQDNWRAGNWLTTAVNDSNRATPGRANAGRNVIETFPPLWINELVSDNRTGLQDNEGEREPWIELYNSGSTTLNLSGYYLSDDPANLAKWQFPSSATINPGQFLVIWTDGESGETTPSAIHTSFRLAATNGFVVLSRLQLSSTAAIDFAEYAIATPDYAYGSFPDGEPRTRRLLYVATPGEPNDPAIPSLSLFFNEWLASNQSTLRDPADGQFEDWFELYNAGTETVDLSGYFLNQSMSDPNGFQIPVGTIIPSGGYKLIWADDEIEQNGPGLDIHVDFKLGAQGEELGLFTPDGVLVDGVAFGAQTANISQGRFPDGAEPPFSFFAIVTPAAPNVSEFANQPPVINSIAAQDVIEGNELVVQAAASDPDVPAQTLTFSMVNPPEGVAVNPQSGRITWTPSELQGPGSYSLTVRVTDNGTPARSVSRTFTVDVAEANQAPTLAALPPASIDEGFPFGFILQATDSDLPAQTLTFSLPEGAPDGASLDPVSGEFSWTPAENQGPAVYNVTFKVEDNSTPSLSATRVLALTVREVDNAPVITAVSAQATDENKLFQLQLQAADPDSPPVALTYSVESAPTGLDVNPSTGLVSWTPDEEDGPRDYNVTVRVSEANGGPSSTVSFVIGVREVNTQPVLAPIPNITLRPGDRLLFTNKVTDPDLPEQAISYAVVSGLPSGATLNAATGVFDWTVPADPEVGTFSVVVRASDDFQPAGSSDTTFEITIDAPLRVAINEIMHRPIAANAEFIELANYSAANTVDLSGWRLEGYNYTFPAETQLEPGAFLCVAKNLTSFRSAYGATPVAVGNASSSLSTDGGIVRLIKPASGSSLEEVIDEVLFSLSAPWPAAAASAGASLQLIDPFEDHARVSNWDSSVGNITNPPQDVIGMTASWRYWQSASDPGAAWTTSGFADTSWPAGNALLYVEGAPLPAAKNTALTLGQTSYYFRGRFNFTGNTEGATLRLNTIIDDGAVFYLNGQEIFRLGMSPGAVTRSTFASRTQGEASLEGPFDVPATGVRQGENVLAVSVHQANAGSSDVVFGASASLITVSAASFTPGAPNSVAGDLAAYPAIWINEILPQNTTGIADNSGEREPWIELYNGGSEAISLSGWSLTDTYTSLAKWSFPTGTTIPAGGFLLVWADGESAETAPGHLHANFRLNAAGGTISLVRNLGSPSIVDYLNYLATAANVSFGSIEDGNAWDRGFLPTASPGGLNAAALPATVLDSTIMQDGRLQITWPSNPNFIYELEACDTLANPEWELIFDEQGTGDPQTHIEIVAPGTTRFYRLIIR